MRTPVLALLLIGAFTAEAAAFGRETREPWMDRPLGMEGRGEFEQPVGFERDGDGRRVRVNTPYGLDSATAVGNSISIQAGVGSTVVLNAQQINRGNQTATTVLGSDDAARKMLKNVVTSQDKPVRVTDETIEGPTP